VHTSHERLIRLWFGTSNKQQVPATSTFGPSGTTVELKRENQATYHLQDCDSVTLACRIEKRAVEQIQDAD